MSEEQLNIKYICENTGLVENDKLIPIILGMIKDSYKAGLTQAEIDNTMGLIEENQKYKEVIDKAIKTINELKTTGWVNGENGTTTSYTYAKPCCKTRLNIIEDILKEVE